MFNGASPINTASVPQLFKRLANDFTTNVLGPPQLVFLNYSCTNEIKYIRICQAMQPFQISLSIIDLQLQANF